MQVTSDLLFGFAGFLAIIMGFIWFLLRQLFVSKDDFLDFKSSTNAKLQKAETDSTVAHNGLVSKSELKALEADLKSELSTVKQALFWLVSQAKGGADILKNIMGNGP